MLENDIRKHCKMWWETVSILIVFRVRFYKKICMRRVLVCVPFLFALTCFPACLTLDPLAPAQSKRSFSIWALPSTMCNFGTPFLTCWRHLGIICHACKTCKSKDRKRREMSLNLGFKTGHQKVVFCCFWCMLVKVRQGGPKGSIWCPRVVPRTPPGH